MISCGWTVMAFAAGTIFGIVLFAWLEIARENEESDRHDRRQ